MHTKSNTRILLIVILVLSIITIFSLTSVAFAKDNLYFTNPTILPPYDNIQTYITEDNKVHTIYWAKGVDAPKMLSKDETASPLDRVFRKREQVVNGSKYIEYNYPVESGKGYYDFNKNPERTNIYPQQVAHHCYLAAALNQIYWWLEQNKSYVDRYVQYISEGIFGQYPGLRPIDNIDDWNSYLLPPTVEYTTPNNYYSMQLSDNPLYKKVFSVYHDRDLGYYSDLVWDYFFNGYFHYHPKDDGKVAPPNNIDLWQPDFNGGLFYNLLGKEKISTRQGIGTYEMFNEVVKKAITSNQGIVINYLSVGRAHAISLWGAEFDENGNITRVYLTDSDDFNSTDVVEGGHVKGLYSNDIVKDNKGNARLTTRADRNSNSGSVIHELALLDLAQDKLDEALNDLDAPIKPKFEKDISNQVYTTAYDIPIALEIKIKREDKGDYLYQWYQTNDLTSEGTPIKFETKPWLKPKIPTDNSAIYYYCVVTNVKNGKLATSTSSRAKVYVDSSVSHAEKPIINYASSTKKWYKYNQYDMPEPIKVNASATNGTITYQWYHSLEKTTSGGDLLVGETSNVFYPNNTAYFESLGNGTVQQHYYYCVATNTDTTVNGMQQVSATVSYPIEVFVEKPTIFEKAMKPVIINRLPYLVEEDSHGKIPELQVNAKSLDSGTIEYQWYMADGYYSDGEKILGANKSTYTPHASNGNKYYYCEVTNVNTNAKDIYSYTEVTSRVEVKTSGKYIPNNNAYLQSINTSTGILNPIFNRDTFIYSINLKHNQDYVIIYATAEHNLAKVNGVGRVDVANGESKVISIVVVAEDNVTTNTYKITITRDNVPYVPSSNNKLDNIIIDGVVLNPVFNSNIYSYNATVEYEVTKLTIIPILADSKANVSILGNINTLEIGSNIITVRVTAEDAGVRDYIINIIRKNREVIPSPDIPDVSPEPDIPSPDTPDVSPEPDTPSPDTPDVSPRPDTPNPDIQDNTNVNKGNSTTNKMWIVATATIIPIIIVLIIIVVMLIIKKRKI